jgi:hypothetical protein
VGGDAVTKHKFRFSRLDRVGVPDADEDREFLAHCYVQTGDLRTLLDCTDSRRVVIGRTGSGKTALLLQVQNTSHGRIISVAPESLALAHITNSTILTFLNQLGVKLDVFFKLLWRHVFTVEILRSHFQIKSESDQIGFMDRVSTLFSAEHRRAIRYLENWGRSFWEQTDYRVKELTTKLEHDVEASIKPRLPWLSFGITDAAKLSTEQIEEVVNRAQRVVNEVQIRELSDILEMLNKVLDDSQKPAYIVIDRLDENWVDDRVRYLLIRALLETVRDFRKVQNAQVIIALRRDLIDRVFRLTRDAGFQEEKFESIYLPLEWSEAQLLQILDARLRHLVNQREPGAKWNPRELLPSKVDGRPTAEYIVSRTLMRPRDMIQFLNECVALAADRPEITLDMLRQAEGIYSTKRLRAVADEWAADYPHLLEFIDLLKNHPPVFPVNDISDDSVQTACLEFSVRAQPAPGCVLGAAAAQTAEGKMSVDAFRTVAVGIFHRTGLLGVKLDTNQPVQWAHGGRRSISAAELENPGIRVAVHPAFWRALGIRPPSTDA